MAKDPAILFYTSDFLTGTMTMSNEQVGKYIRLLCLQHQKEILTEKDMLFICGSYDQDIWSKFKQTKDGFYNERLRLEAEKRSNYSLSRASNRANKNKKQSKKHMKKICKTYDKHMENENVNENVNENRNENMIKIEDAFEKFYSAYPKKKMRGQAEKAFSKLNPDETLLDVIIQAINKAKKSEDWIKDKGRYIPYPATWLNAKGWLDQETESHPLAGQVSEKTIRTVEMLDNWRPPV